MSKKLIFVDIDGTLTSAGSNVPPESALNAIRKAQANGHKVFLCTGRNLDMLSPLLKYGFDGIVGSAGGYVQCEEEVIYDMPMTSEQRDVALDLLHKNGVFCTIEAKDGSYGDDDLSAFLDDMGNEGNSEIQRWRKALAENLNIVPMKEYDGRPVYKVVIMCREMGQLDECRKALEDQFNFCMQEVKEHSCINGELINRAFDKGRGVERVCEHYGMSLEDTIGFGDSMNDLEMMEKVNISVAMNNGAEAIKKISTMVTDSVEEDGLAKAFEKLGLC